MIIAAALTLWVLGTLIQSVASAAVGETIQDIAIVLVVIAVGAAAQFCAVLLILP